MHRDSFAAMFDSFGDAFDAIGQTFEDTLSGGIHFEDKDGWSVRDFPWGQTRSKTFFTSNTTPQENTVVKPQLQQNQQYEEHELVDAIQELDTALNKLHAVSKSLFVRTGYGVNTFQQAESEIRAHRDILIEELGRLSLKRAQRDQGTP